MVTERTVVRRRRQLPIPGTMLVGRGDRVSADSVVARAELAGPVHAMNVANLLGVAPDEIPEYLLKREGDAVGKDEVLAENKPLITWFKTEVRAPITGTLETVSTLTGQVLMREPPKVLELRAYIDGVVVDVQAEQGVTVETVCTLVQGIFGVGGEISGELVIGVESPEEHLTPARLTTDMKGKVVVGGSFLSADTMARAREVGLAALVVGGIHDKDLRELLGYDLGVAITGTERVGFTLVLTEGFGAIPMAPKTYRLLSAHAGQKASVSGATQIRAGVIRPEIIIPKPQAVAQGAVESDIGERGGLKVGDVIRVIRDPLFGQIGQVVALPGELRTIETESLVRVLEVEFPDKRRAVIPRANIELIEE